MDGVVFILAKDGRRLMPTRRLGFVRHLLKDGRAEIVRRAPMTIRLLYDSKTCVQPTELCVDSGFQYVGISLKSRKREFVSANYELLNAEKNNLDVKREHRISRRRRTRHREARYKNRRIPKGWLPPSIRHRKDAQMGLIDLFSSLCPVSTVILEVGLFDTTVLKAVEEGRPIPVGDDYRKGERYGLFTLREAVFQRDGYRCRFCGSSAKDGVILHVHHSLYWMGIHGNSLPELVTCCDNCHTPANHDRGGKLWGYKPRKAHLRSAAFMNTVRMQMAAELAEKYPHRVKITYGAMTKCKRLDLGLPKSHVNDAYSMGSFHPSERAATEYYHKQRRNNRILETFHDAKYVDVRDGSVKSGRALGSERLDRKELRNGEKSLRKFRGRKVKKGARHFRRRHYDIVPGTTVLWNGKKYVAAGMHRNGTRVLLKDGTSVLLGNVKVVKHPNGWYRMPEEVALKREGRKGRT